MTSLWPGGSCEFCELDLDRPDEPVRHERCVGWAKRGHHFCGCASGLCETRLITGVLWDVTEHDTEGEP